MEMHNLEKNILYWLCEELTAGEGCGPVPDGRLYQTFADLPAEKITASLEDLTANGLLRRERDLLYLTPHGRSEIRSFIPKPLMPTCDPPEDCLL